MAYQEQTNVERFEVALREFSEACDKCIFGKEIALATLYALDAYLAFVMWRDSVIDWFVSIINRSK